MLHCLEVVPTDTQEMGIWPCTERNRWAAPSFETTHLALQLAGYADARL